ncbi:gluconokinase [Ekhidna sp.]|uniref:gluconokinase n=2 Tax=Ekhidna sp. TaxID=2608089 RepID=UPI0032995A88
MTVELEKKIVFVMGVSGVGKTSVGRQLASELSMTFIDADDYHPPANIEKMRQAIPLNDIDRQPWLGKLNELAKNHIKSGCVMACSALKQAYRSQLIQSIETEVTWVYLKGDYDQILDRMKNRKDHFMDSVMLKSQFEALEEPENAIKIDIKESIDGIVQKIKSQLK